MVVFMLSDWLTQINVISNESAIYLQAEIIKFQDICWFIVRNKVTFCVSL